MTVTDDAPRKATLFCPECPHEGHPTTEWAHRRDGERRHVVCPDCGATVATRSAPGSEGALGSDGTLGSDGAAGERTSDERPDAHAADATAAWRQACRSWLAVWTP